MREQTLVEMQQILVNLLEFADTGGQEQFEIVQMARGMSDNMQQMIEKLAKLTGDGIINLKAMVMTKMGDEAAMKVEHGITQPLNQCADAMARLKANLDALVNELQNHQPSDLDQTGGMNGADMGMGGQPGADMGADMTGADDAMPGADDAMPGGPMGAAAPAAAGAVPGAPAAAMPPAQMEPERPRKSS